MDKMNMKQIPDLLGKDAVSGSAAIQSRTPTPNVNAIEIQPPIWNVP